MVKVDLDHTEQLWGNTPEQLLQLLLSRLALDLHPVGLGQLVLGVGNPRLQLAIIGQQQQAFAVSVQSPGRVDPRNRNKVLERGAPAFVTELGQHIEGFVEQIQLGIGRRRFGHTAIGSLCSGAFRDRAAWGGTRHDKKGHLAIRAGNASPPIAK